MIHRSVIVTACLTVLGLAVGAGAVAGDFNLVWDASPGATGYKLHYGTQPNQYTSTDDVGNVTQTTLSGLDDCSKWYFAVSAYNSSGESGYSNVVDSFLVREVSKLLGTQRTSAVARQGETFDLSLTGSAFDAGVGMTLIHPDWMCPRPDCLPSERSQSHLDGLTPEVRDTLRIENVQSVSCTEVQARVVTGPGTPGGRAAEEGGYNLTLTRGDGDVFEVNGAVAVQVDPERFNGLDLITSGRVDGGETAYIGRLWEQCDFARYPVYCQDQADAAPPGYFRPEYYDPSVDFDGNGRIGSADLSFLGPVYGRCWDPGSQSWSLNACPVAYRLTADELD